MRLLRLQIDNFRNFKHVDCRLGCQVVLLGENGVGKSNLLHALRLVLDADLPESERYLQAEDFWAGATPFAGTEIVVSIDLTSYADDPALLACLGDHEIEAVPGHDQSVARLTYRYAPRQTLTDEERGSATRDEYSFSIYGRDDTSNEVRRDVRRFLTFKLLHALRDAENDLRAWRRSPLRPLLEEVIPKLDSRALADVSAKIDLVTDEIASQQPLVELRDQIATRINEMIGRQHPLDPALGFASTNPRQILRSLKLFVDAERRWEVSDTSLGLANVIYLALLLLHVHGQKKRNQMAAFLLGIEEPEAHLHPQMQRQIFRDLLRGTQTILVSTHSPNIASVAPIDALVVIRTENGASVLKSFADATGFSAQQRADLTHYLDVTRAEILFSRGIILVEGDAEKFLVPAAARLLDPPVELDDYGISVCSVAGTDFIPYAKLLRHFGIPYVIITDGDAEDKTAKSPSPGISRALDILSEVGQSAALVHSQISKGSVDDATQSLQSLGIFVGTRTLEADLCVAGAGPRMAVAYREIRTKTEDATLAPFLTRGPLNDAAEKSIIGLLNRPGVGKGRFAQRFAASMVLGDVPPHVRAAIESIVATLKS